jgi:hypothetical protein
MKYDDTKTYVVKIKSTLPFMKEIEKVSSVVWESGERPIEFCPYIGAYCIYNGIHGSVLTYEHDDPYNYTIKLIERAFVEMLSELKPK